VSDLTQCGVNDQSQYDVSDRAHSGASGRSQCDGCGRSLSRDCPDRNRERICGSVEPHWMNLQSYAGRANCDYRKCLYFPRAKNFSCPIADDSANAHESGSIHDANPRCASAKCVHTSFAHSREHSDSAQFARVRGLQLLGLGNSTGNQYMSVGWT